MFLFNKMPTQILNPYLTTKVQIRICIGSVIGLLSSVVLLFAAIIEIPFFVLPWLVCSSIHIVMQIIINMMAVLRNGPAYLIMMGLLFMIIYIYMWLVIFSYLVELFDY
ncbi:uncharacterized protein LOC115622032 isoform X2 [Scaptodrosophila lebanonensis]|uniref:Uncharacterized protein LOC115622032 isoform X2 n=1 Tax=Drosophila lebanonensis TaxID=7225 RepID=A0A6J2T4J9_DROLE|nr:uncharacterized protein LOC115622032 isoform X2 [Scaptodrosophila lebanonensis]